MGNTININININKSECIKAGIAYHGDTQSISVDLDHMTPDERAELAMIYDGNKITTYSPAIYGSSHPTCLPSEDALIQMLRDGMAKRASIAERDRVEQEAREADARAAAEAALAEPLSAWLDNPKWDQQAYSVKMPHYTSSTIYDIYMSYPGIAERKCEAQAEADRLNDQLYADRKQQKAEEQTQKEARIAALRNWALAHGSELLRERIAGEFKWINLAQDEFVHAHTLPGFGPSLKVDKYEDRTSPTLEEIRALKDLRSTIEGNPLYSQPRLIWNVNDESYDEETDETTPAERFCSLVVDVTLPDGSTRSIERRL